jgi:FkbM family methyltransferase
MAIKSSMAIDFIRNFVQPGELVFDVGANIGQKADVYAAAGAKVICFEPQPNCVNILTDKYQHNQNIAIVNKGLAEQAGTMQLSV